MEPKVRLYHFKDLSPTELYKILQLRTTVFILEQNCLYADIDGKDMNAYHLWLADDKENILAYSRILPKGDHFEEASIGRVLVAKEHRGNGYGKLMMQKAIDLLNRELGADEIIISAQEYLIRFYQDLGFETVGNSYLEDDIPHVKMKWKVKQAQALW